MSSTKVTEFSNLADLEIDQLEELANTIPDDWSRNLTRGIIDVLKDERTGSKSLEEMTVTDPLTGLGNLRRFNGYLKLLEKHHSEEVVAVLILDLDHFKKINDTHGHDGGDRALKKVAEILLSVFRPEDPVCRVGGEEFAVIIRKPRTVEETEETEESLDAFVKDARRLAKRVCESVANYDWGALGLSRLTVSGGFDVDSVKVLVKRGPRVKADEALYRAKDKGRDCVEDSTGLNRIIK